MLSPEEFLYIVPLKQGLKLVTIPLAKSMVRVFIHSSIKTRIETIFHLVKHPVQVGFYT